MNRDDRLSCVVYAHYQSVLDEIYLSLDEKRYGRTPTSKVQRKIVSFTDLYNAGKIRNGTEFVMEYDGVCHYAVAEYDQAFFIRGKHNDMAVCISPELFTGIDRAYISSKGYITLLIRIYSDHSHIIMFSSDKKSLQFYEDHREELAGKDVYVGIRDVECILLDHKIQGKTCI